MVRRTPRSTLIPYTTIFRYRFSELVAANKYSLKDGNGDAPDWIELRNTGNAPMNLAGWGPSDDPARPMQWTFPDTPLAPHDTLIVFASGRGEALRRFLVEDGAGTDARFWKLAQCLSALYPKSTDEKRWVDGVLARKKGLGL